MPYVATVIKVMIASPGDVQEERGIAVDVIHEWNSIHATYRGQILQPVRWETDTAPEFGDRPQEIINRQVLRDCDLLVGMFWTRLGTPTGVASSGTLEEIQEHLKAGKPAMLYFSQAPSRPRQEDLKQYQGVLALEEQLRGKGINWRYDSPARFRALFTKHLAQTMYEKFPVTVRTHPGAPSDLTQARVSWLNDLAKRLLVQATLDRAGVITRTRSNAGLNIRTNGMSFAELGNPRSEAAAEEALQELDESLLVENLGNKGQRYKLKAEGYRVAKLIVEGIKDNPPPS